MSTWGRVNLGSVCQFRYGKSLPAKARSGSSFPVVGSGGVVGYHDQALLNGPGIVVGRKGSIGSVTWLDDPYWPIDTAYYIETDPALIDLRYLFHALKSLPLESMNKSAAIPGLNRDDAYRLEITLPPLDEQRRIARILDSASHLTTSAFSERLDFINTLIRSRFESQFLQPERSWSTIGDYLESTQYGTSSKASSIGRTPILRMGNITSSGSLDLDDLKYIDLTPKEESKYDLRDGDLLFNRTNSKELVGKTTIYRNRREAKMTFAGYLIRARTAKHARPEYVSAYLNSRHGKATLQLRAKAIVGMANINATELKKLPIPAASPEEQSRFAEFYKAAEEVANRAAASKQLGENLYTSLSTRAFAGEL